MKASFKTCYSGMYAMAKKLNLLMLCVCLAILADQIVKVILLKIDFIEEMRTTWGNKEVPQIFLPDFPYLQNCYLPHLTPYQFAT